MLPPLPPEVFNLSIEQQFELRACCDSIESMSIEQLKALTSQLVSIEFVQRNVIRSLVKNAIVQEQK
jgi:hypothetical protein